MQKKHLRHYFVAFVLVISAFDLTSAAERTARAEQSGSDYPVGIGAFRPGDIQNGAQWFLRNSASPGNPTADFYYGAGSGDTPVVGDWDGTGADTIGVFRPGVNNSSEWFLRNSTGPGSPDITLFYGAPSGDVPIVGDWDGNGTTTVGVWRQGQWLLRNSNTSGSADIVFNYGTATDIPVVGDWDGNGTTTVGVFRPGQSGGGEWFLRNSNTAGFADITFFFGAPSGDTPVVGDWDGNGTTTVGVHRPGGSNGGEWLLRNSNSSGNPDITFFFGDPTNDIPVVGNWRRA